MITDKDFSRFRREHRVDFAVAGGGMAGVCCAITAARLGLKTLLVQNRPVLGGPSSSECDCDADGKIIGGASQYGNRNARETGVIEELKQEAAYRYRHGWRGHWSLLLREWCEKEPLLELWLNTEVSGLSMDGDRIVSLAARTVGSELNHTIIAPYFADCTGDAFVGYEAGAEFRMGREARSEFGESMAPEKSDSIVLGSSIFFRAADVGHPVDFVPPDWAYEFKDEDSLPCRIHRDIGKGYYWIECGADCDTIADNEAIYRKLLAILYGVWDHIKNHGDHGAENYAINWISHFSGKRESRRLMGDYIMCEADITGHTEYPDAIAYGGWNIDLHPTEGIFSKEPPSGPPNAIMCPGVYQIPFRSLYSRNITNLLMAGRNISATHIALSSTRVMATCAVCGQAVGAAAWLLKKYGTSPREIAANHMDEFRYLLYRMDHTICGINQPDSLNLASAAYAKAAGSMPLENSDCGETEPLDGPDRAFRVIQSFINTEDFLANAVFRMKNSGIADAAVRATLLRQKDSYDFNGGIPMAMSESMVKPGPLQDVSFEFNTKLENGIRYFIEFSRSSNVEIGVKRGYLPGCYRLMRSYSGDNKNYGFRLEPEQYPFEASNVLNPEIRSAEKNSMWISDPRKSFPQELSIVFPRGTLCSSAELIFDTNLDAGSPYQVAPECIRDYTLEAEADGKCYTLAEIRDNRMRFRRHDFAAREYEAFRLTIHSTWGAPAARLYQFRMYRDSFKDLHMEI